MNESMMITAYMPKWMTILLKPFCRYLDAFPEKLSEEICNVLDAEKYDEGIKMIEEAKKKYPNSCELVRLSTFAFFMKEPLE
jgi:hypothetical protein